MRGGSRLGAGRPGWRGNADSRLKLDVRNLARSGALKPGRVVWTWRQGNVQTASIGIKVESASSLVLEYAVDGVPAACRIRVARTVCNYGGDRPWFQCPCCSKRCAVVYLSGGGWRCRTCANLAYGSQMMDAVQRTWRKQQKIENLLSGGRGEWNQWQKPKGMHQKTFDRMRGKINQMQEVRDDALARCLMGMIGPARFAEMFGGE